MSFEMIKFSNRNLLSVFLGIALLTACSSPAAATLTLSSPIELQVVQRDNQDQAQVTVRGTLTGITDAVIETKADLQSDASRGQAIAWTPITQKTDLGNGRFSGEITLSAGGWYTVSIRARRGDKVIAQSKVSNVGIGDVFITAGQSNSANYGKPRQKAKDSRVVYYNGKTYLPAQDPIPDGSGGGGSVWPILGDHIASSQEIPVCFRSTTLTWTEVKNWMPPSTKLYKNLAASVAKLGPNGVRAVLWHQGESDSLVKTSAKVYHDRLKTIIRTLNDDTGYSIPWFVAQASFHPGSKESEEQQVAKGQQLLWERNVAHKGAVTDDLGPAYRSDGVHFNQLGLNTHAKRWFDALASVYQWKATAAPAAELPPAKETDVRLHADGPGWKLEKATIIDSKRPRVLLIGDSILNGYKGQVIKALKGKAYVDAWVNPYHQSEHLNNNLLPNVLAQGPYDVVHFNMGLHGWPEGRIKDGTFKPLTKGYVESIKQQAPKARIIWASSTPVTMKDKPSEFEPEINPVIIDHNRKAAEVMSKLKVPVNDLYGHLTSHLALAKGDRFHWTGPAYRIMADRVTASVLLELKER